MEASALQHTSQLPLEQLNRMRTWFNTGATTGVVFRKKILTKLLKALEAEEPAMFEALMADLSKSPEEVLLTEIGLSRQEIRHALKHLQSWMAPRRVPTNLLNLPSGSFIRPSPRGVVLIIGTWNFPIQLMLIPLINALAAGNCVVLKPSEFAPATEQWLKSFIARHFPPELVAIATGSGAETVPALLDQFRFDLIFYTGSTSVGKLIYEMAAPQLTPVVLELGGKGPCVVEADANLKVAAKRIVSAKFVNAGQMCISPDYLLVHESVRDELISLLKKYIQQFYSASPETDPGYGKIINHRQFDRLVALLHSGHIIAGGRYNRESLFIEPTLIGDVSPESPIMQEEIFGPLFPVLSFTSREEALDIVRRHPNPLSFYLFTSSRKAEEFWMNRFMFGNGGINTAAWQFTNHHLPFGGIGQSGIGAYHGRHGFEAFSHMKAIMKSPTWFDPSIKYPPLKGRLKMLKWLFR